MSRVSRGYTARRRRKKILKAARGMRGGRSKLIRTAKNAVMRSWAYAYRDRKAKKRSFRRLWITRINAAARMHGVRYSELIHLLDKADVQLDRKVLADLAITDPAGFGRIIEFARSAA